MNGESAISFKELFSKDIDRNINGVIKANDEKNLDDEVNEYVPVSYTHLDVYKRQGLTRAPARPAQSHNQDPVRPERSYCR